MYIIKIKIEYERKNTDLELQTNYAAKIKTKKPWEQSQIFFIFLQNNAQNVTVDLLHMGFGGALGGAPCRKNGQKKMLRST